MNPKQNKLVKACFVTFISQVTRKMFTLTPTLSQRERASGSLSLWERVGLREKANINPHKKSCSSRLIEYSILSLNLPLNFSCLAMVLLFLLLIFNTSAVCQEPGQWSVAVTGSYSNPIAGLANWFKAAPNVGVSIGQQYNSKWLIEGILEYSRFEEENLTGYPAGKLDLSLEHLGVLVSGRHTLGHVNRLKFYFELATGIFQWEGIRDEIKADSTVIPYVPPIQAKKISELNWGFRSGIGLSFNMNQQFFIDLLVGYRFIVGDLLPTLQPHIELEGVSGFQTLNGNLTLRYFF